MKPAKGPSQQCAKMRVYLKHLAAGVDHMILCSQYTLSIPRSSSLFALFDGIISTWIIRLSFDELTKSQANAKECTPRNERSFMREAHPAFSTPLCLGGISDLALRGRKSMVAQLTSYNSLRFGLGKLAVRSISGRPSTVMISCGGLCFTHSFSSCATLLNSFIAKLILSLQILWRDSRLVRSWHQH